MPYLLTDKEGGVWAEVDDLQDAIEDARDISRAQDVDVDVRTLNQRTLFQVRDRGASVAQTICVSV